MNYLDIVLMGFDHPNAIEYFKEECYTAYKNNVRSNIFFKNCFDIIYKFESEIDHSYNTEKNIIISNIQDLKNNVLSIKSNVYPDLSYEDSRDNLIKEYNDQLKNMKKNDFYLDPHIFLKKHKQLWTDRLDFEDIISVEKSISKAKQQIDLDEPKKEVSSPTSINGIIKDRLEFLLKTDPRKHKPIIELRDYNLLVEWVSYYFYNRFEIPTIDEPIRNLNTSKGNLIYTFILLFDELHPEKTRPDSLFILFKLSFYPYRNDKISNLKKSTKKPSQYDLLIKIS